MTWLRTFVRRRTDDDHADEMREHIELLTEQLVAQGRSPDEARREAQLKFGNAHAKLERIRDQRATRLVDRLRYDLRSVLRSLRATPGFTLVTLTVLALAMTSLVAMFALVDGVMLRPLPFPEADRLVAFGRVVDGQTRPGVYAPTEFLGLRERRDVFEAVAAVTGADVYVRRDAGQPAEWLPGQRVSAEFFEVLRVQPVVGRPFTVEHEVEGRHLVAVISHRLWQRRFGGRDDIVGTTFTTGGGVIEIIGVMPPGFQSHVGYGTTCDVWMPYVVSPDERTGNTRALYLRLAGRLNDRVTLEAAQAAGLTETAEAAIQPQTWRLGPVGLMDLHVAQSFQVRQWMWMLLAAVASVLALAAVNVANLLVVRSTVRGREWALRAALGATGWDITRLLVLESLVLALVGTAVGIFGGWLGIELVRPLLPANLPRLTAIAVDARTIGAAIAAAAVLGLVAGVAPAWQARRGLRGALVQDGRTLTASRERIGLRGALLTAEVSLAVVLVLAGGMFLVSFARVTSVDLGIDVDEVLVAPVRPGAQGLHQGPAAAGFARLQDLATRARAIAGVESVAMVTGNVPLSGSYQAGPITVPGYEPTGADDYLNVRTTRVSPEYFRTLGITTLRGRTFDERDQDGAPLVVVLSEAAARRYFPGRDPLGQLVDTGQPQRVIGIVEDVRDAGPELEAGVSGHVVYVPLAQSPSPGAELMVRVTRGRRDVATALATAIRDVYPDLALAPIRPLTDYLRSYIDERQFNMIVIGVFALLGLTIAGIGIHGVTAYVVVQRTKEIGIRRALGGGTVPVVWHVLRGTAVHVAAGIVLGVGAAFYLSTLASAFLFRVDPHEPWLYVGATGALAACAVVAAILPATRAARVDPAAILRFD